MLKKTLYELMVVAVLSIFIPYGMTLIMNGDIIDTQPEAISQNKKIVYEYENGSVSEDVTDYVVSVVAARTDADTPTEIIKLQCVLVNTYIAKVSGGMEVVDAARIGLDTLNDKQMRTKWGEDYERVYNAIADCAALLSNVVITYQGEVIEPYYHEVSAGRTRAGAEVFEEEMYGYLQSVDTGTDIENSAYLAVKNMTLEEFANTITQSYSECGISPDNAKVSIQVIEKDEAGYVNKIQMGKIIISGEECAKMLGLHSAAFSITIDNNNVRIITKGVGHGLGISMSYAENLAQAGYTYEQIISYFYKNVELVSE